MAETPVPPLRSRSLSGQPSNDIFSPPPLPIRLHQSSQATGDGTDRLQTPRTSSSLPRRSRFPYLENESPQRRCRSLTPPSRPVQLDGKKQSPLLDVVSRKQSRSAGTIPQLVSSGTPFDFPEENAHGVGLGEPSEIHPTYCHVYDSVALLIDIPASSGLCLCEDRCMVAFYGETSGRSDVVSGKRRNHNYGIRTTSPVWYEQERIFVTAMTLAGHTLGYALFDVIDPYVISQAKPLPSICTAVYVESFRDSLFVRDVLEMLQASSSPSSSSPLFYCLMMFGEESIGKATELFDRVIAFGMENGLPNGVSLFYMFCNLTNLRSVLNISRYSRGSVQRLLNTIRMQSKHQEVIEQLEKLISKVEGRAIVPDLPPRQKVDRSHIRQCDVQSQRVDADSVYDAVFDTFSAESESLSGEKNQGSRNMHPNVSHPIMRRSLSATHLRPNSEKKADNNPFIVASSSEMRPQVYSSERYKLMAESGKQQTRAKSVSNNDLYTISHEGKPNTDDDDSETGYVTMSPILPEARMHQQDSATYQRHKDFYRATDKLSSPTNIRLINEPYTSRPHHHGTSGSPRNEKFYDPTPDTDFFESIYETPDIDENGYIRINPKSSEW
ncbi:uncharacterized protein LOC134187883 isoform X2 [Corticium candelabrum]|uniref:uncharacterized protein LOC134187883 isoform X2 n=1 Tax=Corticium candelabrum TaxID=121492 RepID=UPI002E25AEC8|nr:uncharacterized protein LOC134187883 isoform X2 [Corticium candelabrum]